MPLNSNAVGARLPVVELEVSPRMALAFAAAISDDRPEAGEDERPGFTASPFFCASLEWQAIIAGRDQLLGLAPEEAVRAVHAGQDSRFLAPLRPGAGVRVSGQVVAIRPTRAGALTLTQLDVAEVGGRAISTTLSAGLYRDVEVVGPARALIEPPPAEPHLDEDAAEAPVEAAIDLDPWFAHRYTECASIWNPIHTERRVALAAGLPNIIVHGTALWALAGRTVAASRPGRRLARLGGTFSAMVEPGSTITVRHAPSTTMPDVIRFEVLNGSGRRAVSRGIACFEDASRAS
jgi:acyl dehydratase